MNHFKRDSVHMKKIKITIQYNTFQTTAQLTLSNIIVANNLKRRKGNQRSKKEI